MADMVERFTPSVAQIGALGATFAVAVALALLGAWLGGRRRVPEGDLISGWAAISVLFTLAGVTSAIAFTTILYAALAAAAAAGVLVFRRDGRISSKAPLRIVVLSAPLIILIGNMLASQWDEFSQWLPNARFVLEHDGFPRRELPPSSSVFPAYPHGLTLIIYMTSRLAGRLVENAGALFNMLLLLSFGLLVVRLVRRALAAPPSGGTTQTAPAAADAGGDGWGYCALAALSVTMLNPTFVPKVVFTAYADAGTAVALGFCAVFVWLGLNALAADGTGHGTGHGSGNNTTDHAADARVLAWQTGLAATALINVKQVNLVLFAALLAAALLIAWRDPHISLRRAFALLPRMVVLPLVVYAAWRLHVALNLDGGEYAIRPPSQWSIDLIPHVLARMGLIASKKGVYFGIMMVAVVFGVRALRRPGSEFDRLAVIAATVFVLYNGFLLFAYIASFSTYDALHASSYWRYNMHLGGVCLAFAAFGAALLWRRWLAPRLTAQAGTILSRGAIVLVVALPIALSHKVRFDTNARYVYVRAVAKDMARILNPGTRLLVVDADNDGQYVVIMRYLLHGSARIVGEVTAFTRTTPEKLRKLVGRQRASHVWIHQPVPVTVQTFGIQMKAGSSYLLAREQSGWAVAQSWPYGAAGRAKPGK